MRHKLTAKIEIACALYRVGRKFRMSKWQALRYAMREIKPK